MPNFKEHSKDYNWNSTGAIEHINAGSLQRIADATEKMAGNYVRMENDLERYKRWYEAERKLTAQLLKSNASLRGHFKRLKKSLR